MGSKRMASNVCILRLCAFSLATLYLKNSSSASFPGVNFGPYCVPLQSSSQPCVSQMILLEIDLTTIVASQFLVFAASPISACRFPVTGIAHSRNVA